MDTRTDSDLMAAYANACDENAFAELAARHQRMVYRVCLRMLRHHQEADDATQAVFIVLLNKASRLTRKGELTGWLYGVARNVCLEALRKRTRRQEKSMLDETAVPVVEEYRPAHEQVLPFLDEELAGLSGVLRQAVVLRYLQGYDQAEATTTAAMLAKGSMKAMLIAKVKMVAAVVAATTNVAIMQVPCLAKAPFCDGYLLAGEWDTASTASGFFDVRILAPGVSTAASLRVVQPRLHLGYDNTNLYVACEIPISPADYQLRCEAKHPDTLSQQRRGTRSSCCPRKPALGFRNQTYLRPEAHTFHAACRQRPEAGPPYGHSRRRA